MTTPKYYCGTKNSNGVTLDPTCMVLTGSARPLPTPSTLSDPNINPTYTCFHIPKGDDFRLVEKPLFDAWWGTKNTLGIRHQLRELFTPCSPPPTSQQIEQVLQPLFQIIYENYGLGQASLSQYALNSVDMTGKPLCGELFSGSKPEMYKILKSILPKVDKSVDVSNLPKSLKNTGFQGLNQCPDNPSVFVCANSPNWADSCYLQAEPADKSFFNATTISFIVAILILLIVVMVLVSRNCKD